MFFCTTLDISENLLGHLSGRKGSTYVTACMYHVVPTYQILFPPNYWRETPQYVYGCKRVGPKKLQKTEFADTPVANPGYHEG